jgi:hypothetical protein
MRAAVPSGKPFLSKIFDPVIMQHSSKEWTTFPNRTAAGNGKDSFQEMAPKQTVNRCLLRGFTG